RPQGWEDALAEAMAAGPEDPQARAALHNRLRRERDGAEAAADRVRRDLEAMTKTRDRLAKRLRETEQQDRAHTQRIANLTRQLEAAEEERSAAIRQMKSI